MPYQTSDEAPMKRLRSPVYVIANYSPDDPSAAFAVLRAAAEGGVGLVQFRAKHDLPPDDLRELARLTEEVQAAGVPMVINDHVELALQVGAEGVHVGQSDAAVTDARAALGEAAIVGASTPTVEQALQAQRDGASYVAVGAMYPSPTKPERPVVGPARLREVAAAVDVPVCAIGGITASRAPEVLDAGAELVCVISAVSAAPDLVAAARELVRVCDAHTA